MSKREIELARLRRTGMSIGEECYIFSNKIETAEPYLVTIGNHVTVAPEVLFTTHDASANFYLENTSDIYGRINIGDYCFIGLGSIILPGVTIAAHTIVAAGSVITKSFLVGGGVIGGNPAKEICKIEDLIEKNNCEVSHLVLMRIYAVPLYVILLIMIFGVAMWTSVSIWSSQKNHYLNRVWRLINICLCVLSLFVIVKMTLLDRTIGVRELELRPFYTFLAASINNEAYRNMLMNVFLFFPFGLTLPYVLPRFGDYKQMVRVYILIGLLVSVGIEYVQFNFYLGRAETDDVICNVLGCVIGTLADSGASFIAARWHIKSSENIYNKGDRK